ncbi:MAG TPA: error-prone DNA polymerase, partial [Acetobacteraceae bacterium]|nr:error-prone DNA polymerase [Acetobacteraceae bacterium]
MSAVRYAELQCTSHFSFLRGASSCEELLAQAAVLGLAALAIADHNSLAGIVRAHEAAKMNGVRLIVGCRLDLTEGASVLVYPTDRLAYGRLCRLLSLGKRRAGKARCRLDWSDLAAYGEGLIVVLVPDIANEECARNLRLLANLFDGRAYLALTLRRRPNDRLRLHELARLAAAADVPTVVTNDVLFHIPERRILQDVVSCIRHNCTIDDAGFRRERHADRHLKSPQEMARLFADYPDALARTVEIAERSRFSLDELAYQYPEERNLPDLTPQQALEKLTWEGAAARYPKAVPEKVRVLLERELTLIEKLQYAPYFLTVNAIVRFARSKGILCQGRGSAANSAVCYVLGITAIDPEQNDMLFERFVSEERREPPDIDVDFEHERRETVMQWVFETYGRDHAALCATVIRYRARGALRDVGKALGLTEDLIRMLSSRVGSGSEEETEADRAVERDLNRSERRLRLTLVLARALIGFPRHLSQHPGGFVLTRDRLDELVPIEPAAMKDRAVIEWDKDDIDALKFMKVDCLALGMLSCLKRSFGLLAEHKGIVLTLASIPAEDADTYAMIRKADTIGVFQIESRAQMSMLPRLAPRTFFDLVIEVAIVRPGPIQGDMVHPYLRRREGKEKPNYPSQELKNLLEKTLGVPLFQEQAMRIAIDCAGFTPAEADALRRAMASFRHTGTINRFRDKLIKGMVERGYDANFAARIFSQLEGFGSYGFPQSHAASFAQLAYASSWLKCHHPEVFCCALLNSQPMGFYAPAQLVRDARSHGVEVRPVSVNHSRWDCTLEPAGGQFLAVRLGMRMVKGFASAEAEEIVTARSERPYGGVEDLWRRARVPVAALERLAEADGFQDLGLDRRAALWAIRGLRNERLPLFAAADRGGAPRAEIVEPSVPLIPMTTARSVVEDYRMVGLSLRRHPVAFLRAELGERGVSPCEALSAARNGQRITVAGLVLVRQRPGTKTGVVFVTMEDETGIANLIVWSNVFERQRLIVTTASMLACRGRVQREGYVIHVVAERLEDLSGLLRTVGNRDQSGGIRYEGGGQSVHAGDRNPHGD